MIFRRRKNESNVPEDIQRELGRRALQSLVYEETIPANPIPRQENIKGQVQGQVVQSLNEAWKEEAQPQTEGHYEQFADMGEEAAAKADREGVVVKETREHDHRNWSPYSEGEVVFARKEQARAFAREMRRAGKVAKVVKGKDGWVVYVYSRGPKTGSGGSGTLFKVPKNTIKTQPIKLGGVGGLASLREPQLANFDINIPEFKIPEPKLDFDIPLQSLDFEIKLPEIGLDDSFLKTFGGERRGPKKKVRKK